MVTTPTQERSTRTPGVVLWELTLVFAFVFLVGVLTSHGITGLLAKGVAAAILAALVTTVLYVLGEIAE